MKNVINPARVQSLLNPVKDLYAALESRDLVIDIKNGRNARTERNGKIHNAVGFDASTQLTNFCIYAGDALEYLADLAGSDLDEQDIVDLNEALVDALSKAEGFGFRFKNWSEIDMSEAAEEAAPEAAEEAAPEATEETAEQQQNKGAIMKTYNYKNHKITQTNTTTDVYTLRFSRYVKEVRYMYAVDGEFWTGPKFTSIQEAKEWISERIRNNCQECGGIGHTIGFLGSNKVTYPCSKGC